MYCSFCIPPREKKSCQSNFFICILIDGHVREALLSKDAVFFFFFLPRIQLNADRVLESQGAEHQRAMLSQAHSVAPSVLAREVPLSLRYLTQTRPAALAVCNVRIPPSPQPGTQLRSAELVPSPRLLSRTSAQHSVS